MSPAQVIEVCATDALLLPKEVSKHYRYLSLHNIAPKDRRETFQVLSAHLNSLSQAPDIIEHTLVNGWLVRINTRDYNGVFAKTWENLEAFEPYWHQVAITETETLWEGGVWPANGKEYAKGAFRYPKKKKESVFGPWLTRNPREKQMLEAIVAKTGSQVPLVTAEWFICQTAIQADRGNAGYADFLGFKDEKEFMRLIGFVVKGVNPAFLKEIRERVATSGVTLQPRGIAALDKIGGRYWYTLDVRTPKDKSNPLRILNNQLQYNASEQYGSLPNGMWAMGLFKGTLDANGNAEKDVGGRVDSAPDFIASDSTAPYNDRRVHMYLSCIRCHTEGGLQDVKGWVRSTINFPPNLLFGGDEDTVRDLRQAYARKLEPKLAEDRLRYANALHEASGLTPQKFASGLGRIWQQYAEAPVTLERASRDFGMTPAAFQKRLRDYADLEKAKTRTAPGQIDPVVSAWLPDRPEGIPVTAYHEAIHLIHAALDGVVLPVKK